jgi:hypothetical protein
MEGVVFQKRIPTESGLPLCFEISLPPVAGLQQQILEALQGNGKL